MAQVNNGFVVWLTGMSGVGKTAITEYVAARLRQIGKNVELLDENSVGDALWHGIGDSKDERNLIVRRLGFVSNLLSRNNVAVMVAAVSPYKVTREENRRLLPRYIEVYVDCPTEVLIQRDSSGKYKKALAGEIPNFIGITEPYEPPNSPEVTIHSDSESVEDGGRKIFQALLNLGYVTVDELKVITGKRMRAERSPRRGGGKSARGPRPRPARHAARISKASGKKRR